MPSARAERVGRVIREEISRIIREEIHDPIIKAVKILSVTDVEVSPDLKIAKIFVSFYGSEETVDLAFKKLKKATSFIRFKLSENLKDLKFMPEIRFFIDKTQEKVARIMEVFQKIEKDEE